MEKVKPDTRINGAAARTEMVPDAQKEAEILKAKVQLEAGQIYMEEASKQIAKIKANRPGKSGFVLASGDGGRSLECISLLETCARLFVCCPASGFIRQIPYPS